WFDWNLDPNQQAQLAFVQQLIELRQEHPVFARRHWFQGRAIHGSGVHDIGWYNPDGSKISADQWHDGSAKAIAVYLNGEELMALQTAGQRLIDDSFLLIFNAQASSQEFQIPPEVEKEDWTLILDTSEAEGFVKDKQTYKPGSAIAAADFSLMVLYSPREKKAKA
ncbi:MAG: glycogen debranching enzyme, partial [Nodosilinea sp.]